MKLEKKRCRDSSEHKQRQKRLKAELELLNVTVKKEWQEMKLV
jgi:hypothetical protein